MPTSAPPLSLSSSPTRATRRVTAMVPALGLCCMLISTPARAQEDPSPRLLSATTSHNLSSAARAGLEHDDNALRMATNPKPDWLTRYFANLDLLLGSPGDRSFTLFTLSQGGKLFKSIAAADMLLTQLGLVWRKALSPTRPLALSLTLDLKDRSERSSLQDYYRGGAMIGLGTTLFSRLDLEGRAGARTFSFKPNPAASSRGLSAALSGRLSLSPTLALSSSYNWVQRRFDTPQQLKTDSPSNVSTPGEDRLYLTSGTNVRQDLYHALQQSLIWRGPLLLELDYTYSRNVSNSYGQDLRRHNAALTVSAALPLELLFVAHLELQRTRYDDPILLDAAFLVDEDNRNMATLSLARSLWGAWDLEARASIYTQEFGAGEDYRRRTIMLALGYHFERD